MADPRVRQLARQLVRMDERLHHLETVPQLVHSSIDDAAVPVLDADGEVVALVGKQDDGTWGAPPLAGPIPPAPTGITAAGGAGIIHVRWPGTLEGDATAPLDFDVLEVLVDGALDGAIPGRDGGSVTIEAEAGTRYVSARVRTLVPQHSVLTSPFAVVVAAPAESLVAQLETHLAAGLATASRFNTVSTSLPPAAPEVEYPEGAFWTVVELGPPMVELDRHQWVDGAWVQVGLDAGRLVAGTIDAGLIDVVALAAEMITTGVLRTAETGQRLEIDSGGLTMWGVDGDGGEYEMVRLGPAGTNLLTIGSTVVSPDSVSSSRGAFDELTVGGDDLAAVLARLPKGRIGQNRYSAVSAFSSEQQIRLTTRVDVEPGRQYRITVTPFDAQGQGAGDIIYRLGWHWGAGTGTWDTVNTLGWGRNAMSTSEQQFPGIVGELHTGAQSGLITFTFFTSTTGSNGVRLVADGTHPIFLTVDDLGPRVEDAGAYWTYGNGGGGDTTPPPPATTRTTTTWASGGVGGDMSAGDVVQGYYSGVGMRSGGWIFPASMRTALAGSTIEKLEVYLYASHWYYGSGGTASIRPNNGSYTGWVGTAFTSPNWPRKAGRWVTVPASWHSAIAAGTYRGIGVHTTSTSSTYYGRFTGSATKFRATYKK